MKRLIQHYLPRPRLVEINRIFVKAKPERAWPIVRHFELSSVFWIRWLFRIRMALSKLKEGNVQSENGGLNIDEFTREGNGFMILQEIPGSDIVVGSIGQALRRCIVDIICHLDRICPIPTSQL